MATSANKSSRLSVIVPCYRSAATLRPVLEALSAELAGLERVETVVVDSSEDSAAADVAAGFPGVRLLREPARLLPGAARNRGAASSSSDFLLFLDADCVPRPGWGTALAGVLERGPTCLTGAAENGTPSSVSGSLQFLLEFMDFTAREKGGRRGFAPSFQLLVKREPFEATGGFPPGMAASEDLAFALSLRNAGVPIEFEPALRIGHLNRTGLRTVIRHLARLGRWSGAARRLYPAMRGGKLRRFPPAALLLGPYRWLRLLKRLPGRGELSWRVRLGVALAAVPALAGWTWAFLHGLLAGPPSPAATRAPGDDGAAQRD